MAEKDWAYDERGRERINNAPVCVLSFPRGANRRDTKDGDKDSSGGKCSGAHSMRTPSFSGRMRGRRKQGADRSHPETDLIHPLGFWMWSSSVVEGNPTERRRFSLFGQIMDFQVRCRIYWGVPCCHPGPISSGNHIKSPSILQYLVLFRSVRDVDKSSGNERRDRLKVPE